MGYFTVIQHRLNIIWMKDRGDFNRRNRVKGIEKQFGSLLILSIWFSEIITFISEIFQNSKMEFMQI